jgi:hypothetical protein
MSIEAMKQALDALENHTAIKHPQQMHYWESAVDALRQAIEQAEKIVASNYPNSHQPVAWIKEQELAYMSAAAGIGETQWKTNLGLKPEPGDVPLYSKPVSIYTTPIPPHTRSEKLREAGYTRRPKEWSKEDKPEPVAWREIMGKWKTHYYDYNEDGRGEPLYAAPREWIGLTDEERKLIIHEWRHQEGKAAQLCQAIEAKLRSKNT